MFLCYMCVCEVSKLEKIMVEINLDKGNDEEERNAQIKIEKM